MKKILFLTGALFTYLNLNAQWTIEKLTPSFDLLNTQSVQIVGDKIHVGSICDANPDIQDLEVYLGTDDGDEWIKLNEIEDYENYLYVSHLNFVNELEGIAACSNLFGYHGEAEGWTYIIKTNDGGETWETKHKHINAHSFEGITGIDFFDDDHGIAVGTFDHEGVWFERSGWVALTSDRGETWNDIELPESMAYYKGIHSVDVVNETTAYIALVDEDMDIPYDEVRYYIYKTEDKGETWTEVSNDLFPEAYHSYSSPYLQGIDFVDENIGWMIFSASTIQSFIYKTVNGGVTWEVIDHPIKQSEHLQNIDFNGLHFLSENEGFIAGGNYCNESGCFRGHCLIYTQNGGESWDIIKYDETDAVAFTDLDYNPETGIGYVVGGSITHSNGAIYKVTNPYLTIQKEDEIHFNVYPNPSNGPTTVISHTSTVKDLMVFRVDGKKIGKYTFLNNKVELDLESGVYILKSENQTSRLIVQ